MVRKTHRFICFGAAWIAALAPGASPALARGREAVRVAAAAHSHDRATVRVVALCDVRVRLSLQSGGRTVSPTVAMSVHRGHPRQITLPFGARGPQITAVVTARPVARARFGCRTASQTTTRVAVKLRAPSKPAPTPTAPAPRATQQPSTAPTGDSQPPAGTGDTSSSPLAGPLAWAPPLLSSPTTVQVSNTNHALVLDPTRDYLIRMPALPLTAKGGLTISGGHNVVLIGGEIDIPYQGDPPPPDSRRALYLKGQTGTVHVEGLVMTGPDITEGIDLDQRLGATVQLENIRIENVHARDETGFTDNHPDLVQTWAGPAELRVDYLTGSSDYQGFFLNPMQYGTQAPPRVFDLRHVNIVGTSTAGYLLWQTSPFPLALSDVWVQPNPRKSMTRTLWPNVTTWSGVNQGVPAGGAFVPASSAGTTYSTPGYPATPATR